MKAGLQNVELAQVARTRRSRDNRSSWRGRDSEEAGDRRDENLSEHDRPDIRQQQ